jgi:pseudomonalisin
MHASWSRCQLAVLVLAVVTAPAVAEPRPAPFVPLGAPPVWATAAGDLGRAPDAPIAHLTVVLARTPAQQRAFDQLRAEQDTPGSPNYHHWLSPAEIGARFGASDVDVAAATTWLRGQGLTILRVANAHTFIEVGGTVRTAEAAFGVELHRFRVGSHVLRAPDRAPSIPAALGHVVASVTGLTERTSAPQHRVARRASPQRPSPQGLDQFGDNFVGVSDFATIYDLGPAYAQHLDGSGQVIGIIGRSRVFDNDITHFAADEGVTLAPFTTIVPSTGVDPGSACGSTSCGSDASTDDQFEATLDVTRVTSIATGAKVELIVSATDNNGDDGVFIALDFAIDEFGSGADANILTTSFGQCEQAEGSAETQTIDTLYQQAAMQGQTLFVSAGDAAAAGCDVAFDTPPAMQKLGVNALCVSSASTCAGGTEFADFANGSAYWSGSGAALSYIPEGAWNEPSSGSGSSTEFFAQGGGGGISTLIPLPSYQTGFGPGSNTFRLVPDVSLTSSCHDYYFICMAAFDTPCTAGSDDFNGACGTSAASPSLAAIMSLAFERAGSNREGPANPGFYALAAQPGNDVFHDVTVASSGVAGCEVTTPSMCNNSDPGAASLTVGARAGYEVGSGFDMATGLGSVDAAKLVTAWDTSLTLTPSTLSVAAGQTATTDATTTGLGAVPTFACSGLPANAACEFTASGSGGATVTIATSAAAAAGSAGATTGADGPRGRIGWLLAALAFVLAVAARTRRPWARARAAACGLALAATAASCGGGAHGKPDAAVDAAAAAAGTYTVVVTATSGAATATAELSVTITQ